MQKAPVLLLVLFAVLSFAGLPQAQPSVSVTVSPQSVNSGFVSTFFASATGGTSPYTYTWTLPSGLTASSGSCTATSSTCTVLGTVTTSTAYTASVYVTDSSGAKSNTASAKVTINPYQCIIGTAGDLGSCIADSIPLAAIGIMLSLCFAAIAFMLGEVFKIEGFTSWYKTELWEVTKSLLVICTVYGALVIASNISTAFVSGVIVSTGGTPTPAGLCSSSSVLSTNLCMLYRNVYSSYLTAQLQQAYTSFSAIFGLSLGVDALKNIFFSTWFPVPIPPPPFTPYVAFQFGSILTPLFKSNFLGPTVSSQLSFLKDVMALVTTPMVLLFQFQYDLMPVIIVLGLTVLLPMGIILRAIPFLRGIGGTLIGLGVTMSIVYPVLLLALNLPVTSYFSYVYAPMQSGAGAGCSGFSCFLEDILSTLVSMGGSWIGLGMLSAVIGSNMNTTAYLTGYNIGIYGTNLNGINSIFPAMNFVTTSTSDLVVQFILFVLDLMILLVIANAIAKPLGGTVRFGIGKFKLA
jgi:hypothetical protein